jgi:hypothetical protein
MNYVKGTLSGLTAIIISELVPGPWSLYTGINNSKATGMAAVAGLLLESLYSPLFWILVITLFAIFFAASRLDNKPLRVVLFWIPTLTTSGLALAIASLVAYAIIHFRNS